MGRSRSSLEPAVLSPWLGVAQGMCGFGVDTVHLRLSVNSAPRSRRSQWDNSMTAQQAERAREEVGEASLENQAGARS